MTTPAEPRLRGHHLICLQFFRGEGYSARFVDNVVDVLARASDSPAVVVDCCDDVCTACAGRSGDGACLDPQHGEVGVRRLDRLAFELLGVRPGDGISLAQVRERLSANTPGAGRWRVEACTGCKWLDICGQEWDSVFGQLR